MICYLLLFWCINFEFGYKIAINQQPQNKLYLLIFLLLLNMF